MTLKAFHIVFVFVATLTSGGFGVWSIRAYMGQSGTVYLPLGLFSLAVGLALLVYGNWFLKKMKDVSYL